MNSKSSLLEFKRGVWGALMEDLKHRGRGVHESGAFLLAPVGEAHPVVHSWLPYDVLDPESMRYAVIRLETDAFTRLWSYCASKQVKVVADIHTHPKGPEQSLSDRVHPMVALPGHLALIAPWFAQRSPRPVDVSLSVYQGGGAWVSFFGEDASSRIVIS